MSHKITHLLRGLTPSNGRKVAMYFDVRQRTSLCKLLNVEEVSNTSYEIAIHGPAGGIVKAVDLVESAFAASFLAAKNEIQTFIPQIDELLIQPDQTNIKTIDEFKLAVQFLCNYNNSLTIESLLQLNSSKHKKLQKILAKALNETSLSAFETDLQLNNPVGWTIYSSGRDPLGSAWLHAIPKSEALSMQPEIFRTALRSRLLVDHPYIGDGTVCNCGRNAPIDRKGIHLMKCKSKNNLTISTHDTMTIETMNFFQATGSKCNRSVQDMYRMSDRSDGRKADFLIYVPGKNAIAVDNRVSCSVPKTIEDGKQTKFSPGEVAMEAEIEKEKKHKLIAKQSGYDFLPLCMETGGHWGLQFANAFNAQIDIYSRESCIPASILRHYWSARLSMSMQRGVANAVIKRAHFLCRDSTIGVEDESGWEGIIEESDNYNLSCIH